LAMQNWLLVTWHGAKPVPDTGGFLPVEEPGYTRCLYCTKLVTSTKYWYDFPQRTAKLRVTVTTKKGQRKYLL